MDTLVENIKSFKSVAVAVTQEKLNHDLIDECHSLLEKNHAVSGHFDVPLSVNWDEYLKYGDSFVAFTLRQNGVLNGVLFFVLGAYPHHLDMQMAQQVTFFITPKLRHHSYTMMQESENFLKALNIDLIVQSARFGSHFCHTLRIRGYKTSDVFYTKLLNHKFRHKSLDGETGDNSNIHNGVV